MALRQVTGAAEPKDRRLGGLNDRNVLSHGSRGWKFKIKGSTGLVPWRAVREVVFPTAGGFGALLGLPWLRS